MRLVDHAASARTSIPLTVIGGSPGAGKTTVIRHFLENSAHCRILAVVRDIAPFVSGAPSPRRRDGATLEWPNGCMAVASDDATATLATLRSDGCHTDHVLVEANGTANPRRTGGYAYMPGYRPNGRVTIVDASTAVDLQSGESFATTIQPLVQSADLVVLNKLDIAGQEATAAAQRSITAWAPSARFLWSQSGRIAPALVVGLASDDVAADDPCVVAEWRPDYIPVRSERKTMTGEQWRAWCLMSDARADARQFRAWATRLPSSIMHGDGVVFLREAPQHRHVFTLLGSRWMLERGAPWGNEVPATRITLVGIGPRRSESGTPASRRPVAKRTAGNPSAAVM
jgi:G3E family GTPase